MRFWKKAILPLFIIIIFNIYNIFFLTDLLGQDKNNLFSIVSLVFAISLLLGILVFQFSKFSEKHKFPYLQRDDFLSPAEQNFYFTLKHTVSEWALVWPKIRLGDLFYVNLKDKKTFWTYTNKITSKHVDFLLSDPKTAKPLMGVELDDKNHQRKDRKERDEFVDKVFEAGNLPIVRIPVKHSYSTSELNDLLRQYIDSKNDKIQSDEIQINPEITTPNCPKCGSSMILREAKKGKNQRSQFWGCPNYPRCRGIIEIEESH